MAVQFSLLFVCLGNICRSPTAEGVFRARAHGAGLADRLHIDSAGTGSWHVGKAPDPRSQAAALRRGYDLSSLRARQVVPGDFTRFDLILAMDEENLDSLMQLAPARRVAPIELVLRYATRTPLAEVPDPYAGGSDGFERVLDLLEDAADGLLASVQERMR